MQKPFSTQPSFFVSTTELEHPALLALDDTEALLDWQKIESLVSGIYASRTEKILPLNSSVDRSLQKNVL